MTGYSQKRRRPSMAPQLCDEGCDCAGEQACDSCTSGCGSNSVVPGVRLLRVSALLRGMSFLARHASGTSGTGVRLMSAAIGCYQRLLSPRLPIRCHYVPSCSVYGRTAVERFGVEVGARLAAERVERCRPGVTFGTVDPVPVYEAGDLGGEPVRRVS